jgi:hypothetical protein
VLVPAVGIAVSGATVTGISVLTGAAVTGMPVVSCVASVGAGVTGVSAVAHSSSGHRYHRKHSTVSAIAQHTRLYNNESREHADDANTSQYMHQYCCDATALFVKANSCCSSKQ